MKNSKIGTCKINYVLPLNYVSFWEWWCIKFFSKYLFSRAEIKSWNSMTFRLFTNDTLKEKKSWKHFVQTKTIKAPLRWALTAKKNHIYEFEAIYFSLRDIHFLDFTVMIKQKILSSNQNPNKSKNPNNNPNLFHASIVKNYTKSRTLNPKRRLDIRPFS